MRRRLVQRSPARQDLVDWFPVSGFERYLIFYRPLSNGIEVLRVIHGARNIQAVLDEESGD